jgi:hypothetical protein
MRLLWLVGGCLLLGPWTAQAQRWGRVEGHVTESPSQQPLSGVTVLVAGTDFGTATDAAGRYTLRLPEGRYQLRFSAVGYQPRLDSVVVVYNTATRLGVMLLPDRTELEGVSVEEAALREAGVYTLDPEATQRMPDPFRDGLRALKVMPGVATNNELSNQYSVRGGGFNENLIFINGFEVFLPFRPRQGEQEGLSPINADLADRMTFYTGGFPARYGGKLSSALDVQYRRPDRTGALLNGVAYASLLDAGLAGSTSALDGRLGVLVGLRKAQARRFFETQQLKGNYAPDYTDVQALVDYRLSPRHDLEALALWADHTFDLDPNARTTFFGTQNDLRAIQISYDAGNRERDGYTTGFAGLRLASRWSHRLRTEHDLAWFDTVERELLALSGGVVLYRILLDEEGDDEQEIPTGTARLEDRADNEIGVTTGTAQGRWMLTARRHAAEAGWSVRRLAFSDRLDEQSTVSGRSTDGDALRIVIDSLRDQARLDAWQSALYVQEVLDVLPRQPNRLVLTTGLRADHFSFNGEWTLSPRLSARYRANDRLTLTSAWGVYYQVPTYRELRGRPAPGQPLLDALNRDLRSQRAMQFIGGAEYFLPQERLYLRGEAYYKHLSRLISYDIENVRVLYSGENDARGRAYGLDVQVRGEFVPGLESWANYSFLVAREQFLPAFRDAHRQGWIARPTDQRHTFSLFVQDYITSDPSWKLHLRTLFGSGLPYTPPVPGPRIGTLVAQVPGDRSAARYPRYFRFDLGATKQLTVFENGLHSPVRLELTGEILNVFNMVNTIAYSWIPDAEGVWNRIPTRLTPRTVNVRLRVAF